MGRVSHGSATTTFAVGAAIQRSQTSVSELSRELGINPKTVARWRKRLTVKNGKTGPKGGKTRPRKARSTVLSQTEEGMIIAFWRHIHFCRWMIAYALQPSILHLTQSALDRCLQRHGISRLPNLEGDQPRQQQFKRYPIGFFHIDIAKVQTLKDKLYLFFGIDRTSKFAVIQLAGEANQKTA